MKAYKLLCWTLTLTSTMSIVLGQNILQSEGKGEAVVDAAIKKLRNSGIFSNEEHHWVFMKRIALKESRFGEHPSTYRNGYHGGIWQVDSIGFSDTQDTKAHSLLVAKHTAIQSQFGINWKNLKWEELRKPLYSLLAARLKLSNIVKAIPTTLDAQGAYWKDHYNTEAGKGTEEGFIKDVKEWEATKG